MVKNMYILNQDEIAKAKRSTMHARVGIIMKTKLLTIRCSRTTDDVPIPKCYQ